MKQDIAKLQKKCIKCQESLDIGVSLFVEEAITWTPIQDATSKSY